MSASPASGRWQWVTEGYSRMALRNRIPDASSTFPDSAGSVLASFTQPNYFVI